MDHVSWGFREKFGDLFLPIHLASELGLPGAGLEAPGWLDLASADSRSRGFGLCDSGSHFLSSWNFELFGVDQSSGKPFFWLLFGPSLVDPNHNRVFDLFSYF